jgi:hypothetical protein
MSLHSHNIFIELKFMSDESGLTKNVHSIGFCEHSQILSVHSCNITHKTFIASTPGFSPLLITTFIS